MTFWLRTIQSHSFGFFMGLIILIPYTGKMYPGVPSLVVAYALCVPFFLITAKEMFIQKAYPSGTGRLFILGLFLFLTLVILKAHPLQYHFLLQVDRWPHYGQHYFEAKLATILIGNFPSLWCVIAILSLRDKDPTPGIIASIIFCASLCVLKMDLSFPDFLSESYAVSSKFYLGLTNPFFCITGSSTLMSSAALISFVSARKRPLLLLLCVIFMVHLCWTMQRFDICLCILLLGLYALQHKQDKSVWIRLMAVATPTGLIVLYSVPQVYWGYWFGLIFPHAEYNSIAQRRVLIFQSLSQLPHNSWGHGLGSFFFVDSYRRYPHNIILETLYEVGIFPFLLLSFYSCYTVFLAGRTFLRERDPTLLCVALTCLVFWGHALKSGDLASWGVLFFMGAWMYRTTIGRKTTML